MPPSRIANAPRIMWGLDLYWRAYWALCTDRPPDQVRIEGNRRIVSVCFIPWASVRTWAVANDLDDVATEALHHHVRAMDIAYMTAKGHTAGHTPHQPEQVDGHAS